jgi:hypothetical protein
MTTIHQTLETVRLWPLSLLLQDKRPLIPLIQSVHIATLAMVFTSAAAVDLRLLGLMGKDQTLGRMARRYLPWVGWGVLVLAVTGLLLMIAEPTRAILNHNFQIKMLLLAIVGWLTWALARGAEQHKGVFAGIEGGAAAKPVAIASILLWVAIIWCGRWIAYGG